MELKALEDWVLEKQFKSVPNVVDVASFGGITKEYQVRIDPDKLVDYGLSIGRWSSSSATTTSTPAAVSSSRACSRSTCAPVGLVDQRGGHRQNRSEDSKRHAHSRFRHRHGHAGAQDPAGAHRQGHSPRTARSSTTTMSSKASCCCAKAPNPTTLEAIHEKVKELNDHILPKA
jgi:heavy metal efflux system protein